MRVGIAFFVIGLLLFINASSSHVPRNTVFNFGDAGVNETISYVLSIAPVGAGNLSIGYFRLPGTNSPSVPGIGDFVSLPVYVRITSPTNQTIIEKHITTPDSLRLDFIQRGQYNVYLTNNGKNSSPIPIALQFEQGNPENREADKYLLSLVFTIGGIALTSITLIFNFFYNANHLRRVKKIRANNSMSK